MARTWVLVADSAAGRLFESDEPGDLRLRDTFDHPKSRAKGKDIMADRPGRVQQTGSPGMLAAQERPTDPKEVEAIHFAQELVAVLEKARAESRFERLVLVAPPHFLGLLRKSAPGPLAKAITTTVDKNLNHENERTLTERLSEELAG